MYVHSVFWLGESGILSSIDGLGSITQRQRQLVAMLASPDLACSTYQADPAGSQSLFWSPQGHGHNRRRTCKLLGHTSPLPLAERWKCAGVHR